jgi:hypothetical protein
VAGGSCATAPQGPGTKQASVAEESLQELLQARGPSTPPMDATASGTLASYTPRGREVDSPQPQKRRGPASDYCCQGTPTATPATAATAARPPRRCSTPAAPI